MTIQDNGCGIPLETLAQLKSLLHTQRPVEDIGIGIGMENAFLRIRSYYPNNAVIFLRSWPNWGTKIVLLLPRINEDGQGDP